MLEKQKNNFNNNNRYMNIINMKAENNSNEKPKNSLLNKLFQLGKKNEYNDKIENDNRNQIENRNNKDNKIITSNNYNTSPEKNNNELIASNSFKDIIIDKKIKEKNNKQKINNNNIKRTLDDLFLWQEKINKEKEEMKQLYEEFTEKKIQNMKNYRPKNNYYSNMKYLEKMAEKMKYEENKDNKEKNIESKSSHLTTNGYVDVGFEYDVWPLHAKKNFP